MFASTLRAMLFSLRGKNRKQTCVHTQICPETLEEDQAAPPLRPYDAGRRCLDAGPKSHGVGFDSAHNDRFHHRSIVARLASSVEGLEARLDLQERLLQRLAGQVAKETFGSSAENQSDHGTATAERHERCYEANTSREPPVEANKRAEMAGHPTRLRCRWARGLLRHLPRGPAEVGGSMISKSTAHQNSICTTGATTIAMGC